MKIEAFILILLIGTITINVINCQTYTCSNVCANIVDIANQLTGGSCTAGNCSVSSTTVNYCVSCVIMGSTKAQCSTATCNNANGRFKSSNIIYGVLSSLAFILLSRKFTL